MKIKKLLCAVLAAVVAMPTVSAFAATEDPVQFSTVDEMNGQVYVAPFSDTWQDLYFKGGNIKLNLIPQIMLKYIYPYFCSYNDRFYYMDGDSEITKIYSCDRNGNNDFLIADKVLGKESVYIVDNILYYTAYSSKWDYDNKYSRQYYGGIYKVNLITGEWQRVVTDDNAIMSYCDGDYIYYSVENSYYQIDTNGNYCHYASQYTDEFRYCMTDSYRQVGDDYIGWYSYRLMGNKGYYIDENNRLYCKWRNTNEKTFLSTLEKGYDLSIQRITKNYIYYSVQWWDDPFVWLYRIDRY